MCVLVVRVMTIYIARQYILLDSEQNIQNARNIEHQSPTQGRRQGEERKPPNEKSVVENGPISDGSIFSNKFSKIKIK